MNTSSHTATPTHTQTWANSVTVEAPAAAPAEKPAGAYIIRARVSCPSSASPIEMTPVPITSAPEAGATSDVGRFNDVYGDFHGQRPRFVM